jgi:hypothetical protein
LSLVSFHFCCVLFRFVSFFCSWIFFNNIIHMYVNSLDEGNTSLFDILPSRKEFNVDQPNIHISACVFNRKTTLSSVHRSYSFIPMHTLALLYFAELSFLCRSRKVSVNVFFLPRFDFRTSDICICVHELAGHWCNTRFKGPQKGNFKNTSFPCVLIALYNNKANISCCRIFLIRFKIYKSNFWSYNVPQLFQGFINQ